VQTTLPTAVPLLYYTSPLHVHLHMTAIIYYNNQASEVVVVVVVVQFFLALRYKWEGRVFVYRWGH